MTNSHNVTLPIEKRAAVHCQTCRVLLPVATRGRLPRYCSDACKQAAYRHRAGGRKATFSEILAGIKQANRADCDRLLDALYTRLNEVGNDHS